MEEYQPSFISEYNTSFQGARGKRAQPVNKHSSVVMGDPVKTSDRETTYTGSFSWPIHCSRPVVADYLKFKFGDFSKESWSTITRQTYSHYKLGEPVVGAKRNKNSSSVIKGEIDESHNKERMSVTTNRISFPDLSHSVQYPVCMPGPELLTKSHVQFNPPHLAGLYYTTTAQEHYGRKCGEQARPAIHLPSDILSESELAENLSITKTDFLPLMARRRTPCVSQHRSVTRPLLTKQYFSTTHSEDYRAKPLLLQHPSCNQFLSHFVLK